MSILIDNDTRVVVQGITGHQGIFHTKAMKDFGTNVVAGVTPGKGGHEVEDVPVFNSVMESMEKRPNTSCIFVPAPFAKDAVLESIDAGIKLIVIVTEHIPFHDALQFVHYSKLKGTIIVGPNTPGIVTPGKSKVGIMPGGIFNDGKVGVISRSGTLTYEIVEAITKSGMGQSTCLGLGGDPINGTNFIEALKFFDDDIDTEEIVLVGEIGGSAEEEAASYIHENIDKKVVAYIAGRTAPPGKIMGHAGAIISRGKGTAESKIKAFNKAGVEVALQPRDVPKLLNE